MRSITAKGIWKSFGSRTILSGVNLTLVEGNRLALVGENGSGKSTLLKILTGHLAHDQGEQYGDEQSCVLIAQDFSGKDTETPREFFTSRLKQVSKAIKLLGESGFDLGKDDVRLDSVKCGNLSGGEKKKLEIVAGLSSGATFIALDEPENHLDHQAISWLVDVITKFHGGVIFVSHDQYFINETANTILELEAGVITAYSMKYEDYLSEKERQIDGQARNWMIEEKTIKRLRKTVQMMQVRAARSSGTAVTYQQTKRRLSNLEDQHGKRPIYEQRQPRIHISGVERKQGKVIVSIENVSFSYGNNKIFTETSADLRFGEKVALFGPNGSGKSTLLRIITNESLPSSGMARIGMNVRWQLMTQDHLEGLDRKLTALEIFSDILRWPEQRCRASLARYGLTADIVTRPLGILSGGQQARFKLALMFAQEPEFLILDEPTNHVDPPTWDAIVESVKAYSGTVLAVTHDREFIDAIAEKLWVIKNRKIWVELGSLTDYLNNNQKK